MKTYFIRGYKNGLPVGGWFWAECGTKALEEYHKEWENTCMIDVWEEKGNELVHLFRMDF